MKYERTVTIPKIESDFAKYLLQLNAKEFYIAFGNCIQLCRRIAFSNGNEVHIYIHNKGELGDIMNDGARLDIKVLNPRKQELEINHEFFSNYKYIQTYKFSSGGDEYVIHFQTNET